MNETRLCAIEQAGQFLSARARVEISKPGESSERYEHISRVFKRFDYPRRTKRERGALLEYLQLTGPNILTATPCAEFTLSKADDLVILSAQGK